MTTIENIDVLGYKGSRGALMTKPFLDHKQIIESYLSGKSYESVAKEVGCSKAAIPSVLRQHGMVSRTGAKRGDVARMLGFTPSKEWLLGLMEKSESAAEAARSVGINYHTFIDLLDKFGVDREPWRGGPGGATKRQEIPTEEAIKLSGDGWTYEQLAAKYGVSYFVISKRMLEAGYRAPKNRMRRIPANAPYARTPFTHKKLLIEMGATCCHICGYERYFEFAHIVPRRDKGPTVVENGLPLCGNCHPRFDLHLKYPDQGYLTPEEFEKVRIKVKAAIKLYGRATIQEAAN